MASEPTNVEEPIDPDLLRFIESLAVADARRDHLRETGQLDGNPPGQTTDLGEAGQGRR